MAQTKRKRQTKHRGNAAGVVEARGRTGRKPTSAERKSAPGTKPPRPNRFDHPPTWIGAAKRAGIATMIFVVSASPGRGVWPREGEGPVPANLKRWERLARDIALHFEPWSALRVPTQS